MIHTHTRSVLFLLRRSSAYWNRHPYGNGHTSSGLYNSARFVREMLKEEGVRTSIEEVVDGNDIDRVVTLFNPDYVILEAIWCPPYKLHELVKLHRHKHRRWIVRNHSEMPFLAMEGIALNWLLEYAATPRTTVSSNSPVACADLNVLMDDRDLPPTLLLPNYYPLPEEPPEKNKAHDYRLDIGCFGAIRPLKNHLEQAIAAVALGAELDRYVNFHINSTRVEGNADPVLKSLRAVFHYPEGKLIEHPWMEHADFVKLCAKMELGMQVSFSETFSIVAADLVAHGVPVVGSSEIPWLPDIYQADPTSSADIARVAKKALKSCLSLHEQFKHLKKYCRKSKDAWLETLFPE